MLLEIIIPIAVVVFIIGGMGFFCFRYVQEMKKAMRQKYGREDRQTLVKSSREAYGVVNRGTSMDGSEIFSVTPEQMGLCCALSRNVRKHGCAKDCYKGFCTMKHKATLDFRVYKWRP